MGGCRPGNGDMLKILAVTGSRADWGLLAPPLALLRDDPAFDLKLVVTGQHLTQEGRNSLREIEDEGFLIDERIDLHLGDDSEVGVSKSLALAVSGSSQVIDKLRPNLIFVLGDRYEILGVVSAALIARVPVAHLGGGDITEGAIDDAMRHAITKMSHLHFVTNAEAAMRLRQMGENPSHVYNVGSTGIDRIRTTALMSRADFFESVGLVPHLRNVIVTFQPVTLGGDGKAQCSELLMALESFGPEIGIIFTGVNADMGGHALQEMINAFVGTHSNAIAVTSLGSRGYFSALSNVDAVIGNSSSGLYEAPSFKIPTVNIGDRQKGRVRAASVIDCAPEQGAIHAAIDKSFAMDCSRVENPYGDGHASERIMVTLKAIDPSALVRKRFRSTVSES